MKPLLKWAGNKARIAPTIASHLFPDGPRHDVDYVEPFLGAGGFALYALANKLVDPARCVLSDANERLIRFWIGVRRDPDGVAEELDALPREDGAWQEKYADIRALFNSETETIPSAARLIWLNRAGFNGLYRENKSGGFNVPIGRPPGGKLSLPTHDHIVGVAALLRGVRIARLDFERAITPLGMERGITPGALIYADPPYVPTSATSAFTSYSADGFTADDQRELAGRLTECGAGRVVASNSATPAVEELYPEPAWTRHRIQVSRSISRKADGRGKVDEYLLVRGARGE